MLRYLDRVLVLGLLLVVAGCGPGDDPMAPDPPEATDVSAADSVVASTAAVTFESVGDTMRISVTALDPAGDTIATPSVSWFSSAPTVASVSGTGLLTALANGSAEITATVDSASAIVNVTVAQVATAVVASIDTLVLPGPGEMAELSATVVDAGGSPVDGAAVSWSIDEPGIATIDGFGNVSAVSPGETTAHAATGGGSVILSADIAIVVSAPTMGVDDVCADFSPDAEPAFASATFEAAVRAKLGIGPGDPMTCASVATIDSMRVAPSPGSLVLSLGGAQNLVGLDTLLVAGHAISDLAPLGSLPELSYLVASNNDVDDDGLVGIGMAATLKHLEVGFNPITDLAPVAGLDSLRVLRAPNTDVAVLTPVSGLTSLVELVVGGTDVADLSPIAGLGALEILVAGNTNISDLSPLAGLTGLREAKLNDNAISDLSPLASLTDLEVLWVPRNGTINGVSALSGLSALVDFQAQQNAISSLVGMEGWTSVEMIELTDNPVSDLGPLAGLTSVRVLELIALAAGFDDVSALATMTGLQSVNLGSNGALSNIDPLIANPGLGAGDEVQLALTAVNCTSADALRAKGVTVTLPGCPG